ncbi:MAG: hypothetical protein NTX75_13310 [Proteobacteria bacterium]|nr:hypothetical protein [Pseudomonadota bacterium]
MKKETRQKKGVKDLPLEIKAEMALKEAVAEVMAEHKRRGYPIAVWRDNKAVWITPEEIVVPHIQEEVVLAGEVHDYGENSSYLEEKKPKGPSA